MSHAMTASPISSFRAPLKMGNARRGRQRKCWIDNIKKWTSLPCQHCSHVCLESGMNGSDMSHATTPFLKPSFRASWRKDWRRISAELSFMSPRRSSRSRDWTELNWTLLRGYRCAPSSVTFILFQSHRCVKSVHCKLCFFRFLSRVNTVWLIPTYIKKSMHNMLFVTDMFQRNN